MSAAPPNTGQSGPYPPQAPQAAQGEAADPATAALRALLPGHAFARRRALAAVLEHLTTRGAA